MSFLRRLSPRERIIAGITAGLAVIFIAYYGFLSGFVEQYQDVSQNLEKARTDYLSAKDLLKDADKVDREYKAIAASLPTRQPGKSPEAVFVEEVDSLLRRVGIAPLPTIRPAKDPEPVPGVAGFSYLILPVENIRGTLPKIVSVLAGFYGSHFLIQTMNIRVEGANTRAPELVMAVEVAQIVRSEDLGITESAERGEKSAEGGKGRTKEAPADEEGMGNE